MSGVKSTGLVPRRMASWWGTLEDLLWPERKVIERIKRRAEGFAEAGIDTAINFGFHFRFDFSTYFGSLHGYLAEVSEELHKHGIRFMDHYSCNLVARPRGEKDLRILHGTQRHAILLHPDPKASVHAQYEGHLFQDLCEMDVRDGSRGYSWAYQSEMFCHNNPAFLDMHRKYLERLMAEVPMDAIEVDDMCDYGGPSTCGCSYCLERFGREYGHELPSFGDTGFWGDTSGSPLTWGNYENPIFRDWLRMKTDSVVDHVKLIKSIIGDMPLMTCCSSTGPIVLNAVGLNLERMMGHLDMLMLENCGLGVHTVNWDRMDAEALQQKDIAEKMGEAPAIALSYTIFDAGGYLGWCLSRFWGVGNWSSTLCGQLEHDPEDSKEIYEIVGPIHKWEQAYSDLNYMEARDVPEIRLASNRFCKENGWMDDEGSEHWSRVTAWSKALLHQNIGYRLVREEELADSEALLSRNSPLVLDRVGCVSDAQAIAIRNYLKQGGHVWLILPFGTHDEKGFKRDRPISDELLAGHYPGLSVLSGNSAKKALDDQIRSGGIIPRILQVSGDSQWAARLRVYPEGAALHLLNRGLQAVPHPTFKDASTGEAILLDIKSASTSNQLEYIIDFEGIGRPWEHAALLSPELKGNRNHVRIENLSDTRIKISVSMDNVDVYGVVQQIG